MHAKFLNWFDMKKFLFTMFMCFAALFANAQINRTIFGIQLGSTGSAAKQVLQSKGLKVETGESELGYTIVGKEPIFSGVQWDYVLVTVNSGKVYSVSFAKEKDDFDNIKSVKNEGEVITNILQTKYALYSKNPLELEMPEDAVPFEDGKTRLVILNYRPNSYKESLLLWYMDLEGAVERTSAIYDEL